MSQGTPTGARRRVVTSSYFRAMDLVGKHTGSNALKLVRTHVEHNTTQQPERLKVAVFRHMVAEEDE